MLNWSPNQFSDRFEPSAIRFVERDLPVSMMFWKLTYGYKSNAIATLAQPVDKWRINVT